MSDEKALSDLCLSCAICCDGTLFSRVPVTPTEAKVLEERGFELQRRKSGASIPLGCQALREKRCTAYEVRPGSCRAFRCAVYLKVENGELDVPGAQALIAEAKALRQRAVDDALDAFLDRHFVVPS